MNKKVKVGPLEIANDKPFTLIAGPCQMERRDHAFEMCGALSNLAHKLGIPFINKSSFDKANRTSQIGKRGLGLDKSLSIFIDLKKEFGVPMLNDIHNEAQCVEVVNYVDILQLPAILCRQPP